MNPETLAPQRDPARAPTVRLPRWGAVEFLNAKPLLWGLPGVELMTPHNLAAKLADGQLDIGLVPVAAALDIPDLLFVRGVAVGCRGAVRSVILVPERPGAPIRSIALDGQSRTSNALARILFECDPGQRIEWRPDGADADARVLIGDRALAFRRDHPGCEVVDLGKLWVERRGLPFVFAVWAIRAGTVAAPALAERLRRAKEEGLRQRECLAQTAGDLMYLTENIRFDLGDEEIRGLEQFQNDLIRFGLIPKRFPLHWI